MKILHENLTIQMQLYYGELTSKLEFLKKKME